MSKTNIEKQVKIFGTIVMLGGFALLILVIYSIYWVGAFQGLSDFCFLIFGPLLLIAGFGLVKFRSWARKMMLCTMSAYLVAGICDLFCSIGIIFPPKIDHINTDYHLSIYALFCIVIMFVVLSVLPTVFTFYLLNRKQIRDLFIRKKIITNQISE